MRSLSIFKWDLRDESLDRTNGQQRNKNNHSSSHILRYGKEPDVHDCLRNVLIIDLQEAFFDLCIRVGQQIAPSSVRNEFPESWLAQVDLLLLFDHFPFEKV